MEVATTQPKRKNGRVTLLLWLGIVLVSATSFFHSIRSIPDQTNSNQPGGSIASSLKKSLAEFKGQLSNATVHSDRLNQNEGNRANDEAPIPNPTTPAPGHESVSACLLVMDDNHRLVEWLAYHFHVLPLRYLIVAVDPRSKTSPTSILNRYRKIGMTVEEWDDLDFMRKDIAVNKVSDADELQIKRDRHRMRQKVFYRKCLLRMKEMNRTYTMLIDTDEYLTYNHKGGDQFEEWEKQQLKLHDQSRFYDRKRIPLSQAPPSPAAEGQLLPYIRREKAAGHPFFQKTCISMPRLQVGAIESTEEERHKMVPHGFDAHRYDTLRFRKHAYRNDFVKNGLAKVMIDVSEIDNVFSIQTVHRPMKKICKAPWNDDWESGLRINHYLGSWEAYSYRDDARRGGERSKEGWSFKAQDADDTDDNIRPWLGGFVEKHGKEKASELLEGAGLPREYKNPNETAWTIMFLDEIMGVNETKGNDIRVQFDNFVRDMHRGKDKHDTP